MRVISNFHSKEDCSKTVMAAFNPYGDEERAVDKQQYQAFHANPWNRRNSQCEYDSDHDTGLIHGALLPLI